MGGAVALCAVLLPFGAGGTRAHAARRASNHVAFHIRDPRITESSGLAGSARHPGVVYTHNDSDGAARVFAVGPHGRTKATLTLADADARDWEAVAVGRDGHGQPAVYVGDIGDNLGGKWPSITVYRFTEPRRLTDRTVHPTRFTFRYAAGPRNAEAMMINPATNRLYIISKEWNGGVYTTRGRPHAGRTNVLHRVADAPALATDAAYAPDGSSFVIRTYVNAAFYTTPGKRLGSDFLPGQQQGESVTYTPDGTALLIGSEGRNSPVWRVPVAAGDRASASPTPRRSSRPARTPDTARRSADDAAPSDGDSLLTGFVIAVLGAAVVLLLVRRRR